MAICSVNQVNFLNRESLRLSARAAQEPHPSDAINVLDAKSHTASVDTSSMRIVPIKMKSAKSA